MFDLDHIFICTSTGAPQAEMLIGSGLAEGPENVHPGQGTANRRFFFADSMLELLWVHDEAEVQSPVVAPTLLWERFRFQETGYSPFGICVRPSIDHPAAALPQTWGYKPPYMPPGLQIDAALNSAYPSEPMLFQTPFRRRTKKGEEQQAELVRHPLGVENITRVILHMPFVPQYSPAMQCLLETNWLAIEPGDRLHMTLEFDHCQQQKKKDFAPELPLTMQW